MQLPIIVLCAINALLFIQAIETVPIPPEYKPCARDSEDFASCLKNSIQQALPTFIKGVPELDIPRLDPYEIKNFEVDFERGNVRGKGSIKNVMAYGARKLKIQSVTPKFEGDRVNIEVDALLPKLFVEGEFKRNAYIGAFRIDGEGKFNVSIEGIKAHVSLEGYVKDDRWIIEHVRFMPEISNMKIWFSNAFNGNEELNQMALQMSNEYWPMFYKRGMSYAAPIIDSYVTKLVNRVFSKISFSELFP